jgi:DNA-damage-inducible protein J
MARTTLIQVRVDEEVKRRADTLFADLGLDTPTAIRMFLSQSLRREGMPFEVAKSKPNAETLAAMLDEMGRIPKRYNNFKEIVAEIRSEIDAEEDDGITS